MTKNELAEQERKEKLEKNQKEKEVRDQQKKEALMKIEETMKKKEAAIEIVKKFIQSDPVKAALAMMGKIEEVYRLPLCEMSAADKETLRRAMISAGVL